MDNASKAFIMGASVLLFIIALSIGVYMYTVLMETTDSILTTSEQYSKTAEYFVSGTLETTRTISAAELIMSIQNLGSVDYSYKSIMVNGFEYKKDNIKSNAAITRMKDIIKDNKKYFILNQDLELLEVTYSEI